MANPKPDFEAFIGQVRPIVLDAELTCASGQLLALVGASGSGKSTLMRMIAGLSRPQSGRISCGGELWFDAEQQVFLTPQQRRIGYVPQHYGLFPHMSALRNICTALHHLPPHEQHERAQQWISRMHLDGLEQRRPAELSGGQQQRVALARALAGNPSILLLDEPFSAVDSATREKLHGELAELKAQLEIPVIMVTHDLNEALMLADSMSLLSRGVTLQSGLPRELITKPISEAAAQLVGIRNMFDSEIAGQSTTGTQLRLGNQLIDSPYRKEFSTGQKVRWAIPDNGVRFRAITRAQPFTHNKLDVTVQKLLMLGDEARLTMHIDGVNTPLQASIPLRLASELGLGVGKYTSVMLRAEDIHIIAVADADADH